MRTDEKDAVALNGFFKTFELSDLRGLKYLVNYQVFSIGYFKYFQLIFVEKYKFEVIKTFEYSIVV